MSLLQKRKPELLAAAEQAVKAFLSQHPGLRYYCFAFDCNAEYAEINLCLNTEEDFQETLLRYKSGPYGEYYRTEEDIRDLRYNPGDWKYQCFETFFVLDENEIQEIYGEDDDRLTDDMMHFSYELLAQLCRTEGFSQIPKTEDFRVLCIDHDADVDDALQATSRYVPL